MAKLKQIGLEKYLNFDSVKFLVKQLIVRTLKCQKLRKLSYSTLTTAFTNEFMGKQKQIGLGKYLKFDSVKFLAKRFSVRTIKVPKSKQTVTF